MSRVTASIRCHCGARRPLIGTVRSGVRDRPWTCANCTTRPTAYRPTWAPEVIAKAKMLRQRGLSYGAISKRLGETMDKPPRWDTIRDWCAGRSRYAAGIEAQGVRA